LTVHLGFVAIRVLQDRDAVRSIGSRVAHLVGGRVDDQLVGRSLGAAVERRFVIRIGLRSN
jgi:hypothetical protein